MIKFPSWKHIISKYVLLPSRMNDIIFAKIFVLERLTIFISFFCSSFLQTGTKLADIMNDENSEDSRKVEFANYHQLGYDVDMRDVRPLSNELRTLRVLHESSSQGRETRPSAGGCAKGGGAGSAATQSRPGPHDNNSQDWESRPLVGTQTGAGSANAHCAPSELYYPIITHV